MESERCRDGAGARRATAPKGYQLQASIPLVTLPAWHSM